MGKVILGGLLLVAGLFMSFIPPFIWGAPLFIAGLVMGIGGLFGTTVSAAKTVVAVSKEVSRASAAKTIDAQATPVGAYGAVPSTKEYDEAKWHALKEFDDDIRAAAHRIAAFGPAMEDKLAKAYLAISDKAYLQSIVNKLEAEARA